jgi:hypothetical protein
MHLALTRLAKSSMLRRALALDTSIAVAKRHNREWDTVDCVQCMDS